MPPTTADVTRARRVVTTLSLTIAAVVIAPLVLLGALLLGLYAIQLICQL